MPSHFKVYEPQNVLQKYFHYFLQSPFPIFSHIKLWFVGTRDSVTTHRIKFIAIQMTGQKTITKEVKTERHEGSDQIPGQQGQECRK